MTIEFQFTRDDYLDAYRAHFRKGASLFSRLLLKGLIVGGCILVGMGVFLVAMGERRLNVWLVPAALGAFWIWIGIGGTYKRAAKAQFEKSPALRQPRRVEFTAQGIKTDAGVASSDVNWKAYLRYVESDKVFLLYTSPGCFVIIPKRVLQSGQAEDLGQLFRSHIGVEAAVATA